MEDGSKAPLLLEFLFGETAGTAQRGASERLLIWAAAFDEWMAERRRKYKPTTTKQSKLAWRRLMRDRRQMPWELGEEDIQAHAAWMEANGYAASTIYNALGIMANFFNWCDERRIDPECEPGFNPAAGVKRPKIERYATANLLSKGEVGALLGILQRDESALGKRDYAFILARVRLGVPLRSLQRLQWGQLRLGEQEVSVRWRAEAECVRLPQEVWEAIRGYLAASGRLAGMQVGDFIFAPLAEPGSGGNNSRAEDWVRGRCVSYNAIRADLKLYGRLAKIPEERLTLQALRRTVTRLRLDEGDSIDEMQVFLNSQEEVRFTKYRLGKLPRIPEDEGAGEEEMSGVQIPDRKAKPFKPGEGITHGYYAQSQPEEEVLAVLAEGIEGIEEEFVGLRMLARGLVERLIAARGSKEVAQLANTHSLAASRLAEMMDVEKQLTNDGEGDQWVEDILAAIDVIAIEMGKEPVSEEIRAEDWENSETGWGDDLELGMTSRMLVEEIAAVRYSLRNVLELALEASGVPEYVRMVEIYGSGCARLVRMLKKERRDQGRLERYLREVIEAAHQEVLREWGRL